MNPTAGVSKFIRMSFMRWAKSSCPRRRKITIMIRRRKEKVVISLILFSIMLIKLWRVFHDLANRKTLRSRRARNAVKAPASSSNSPRANPSSTIENTTSSASRTLNPSIMYPLNPNPPSFTNISTKNSHRNILSSKSRRHFHSSEIPR